MHDAKHIANHYIDRANKDDQPLTHLQVQKLVYYAHAWMLAFFDEPMIHNDIEVWRHGPVVPAVYYCLSHNRGQPIREPIPIHASDDRDFTAKQEAVLNAVFNKYASRTGPELSALTHRKGTPWERAKSKGEWYISDDSIRRYYSKLARSS